MPGDASLDADLEWKHFSDAFFGVVLRLGMSTAFLLAGCSCAGHGLGDVQQQYISLHECVDADRQSKACRMRPSACRHCSARSSVEAVVKAVSHLVVTSLCLAVECESVSLSLSLSLSLFVLCRCVFSSKWCRLSPPVPAVAQRTRGCSSSSCPSLALRLLPVAASCGPSTFRRPTPAHRHGMAWHGMAWHGMAWHGMAWHGMAWHSMA